MWKQKYYTYIICGKVYAQISGFLQHQGIHRVDWRKCAEIFGTYTALGVHQKTQQGENQYHTAGCVSVVAPTCENPLSHMSLVWEELRTSEFLSLREHMARSIFILYQQENLPSNFRINSSRTGPHGEATGKFRLQENLQMFRMQG